MSFCKKLVETELSRGNEGASASAFYANGGKRWLDVFLVILGAPIALAILVPLTILVALDGHTPIFSQMRVGRDGKAFRMWKIRSMVIDAERVLENHLAEDFQAQREWSTYQKLSEDPRITWIGRVMRPTSLDELPQLWNVLRGDMSLVGPRPVLEEQLARYTGKNYQSMRPGITGLWQVLLRNKGTIADQSRLDDQYFQSLNLGTDLAILLQTVPVVLRATGR